MPVYFPPLGSLTDVEFAQDAVGSILVDSSTIDFTYNDATPSITAAVLPLGIKLDDLGAPDDNTDLDASTSAHGLLPKLPGGTTDFLRAYGTFATPAGGVSDGDKGDVTVSSSGTVWTIDNDVVTFPKMQNIASARLLGRDSGGSGDIEELTAAEALTLLGSPFTPGTGLPYMYPNGDAIVDDLNDNFRLDAALDTTGARFSGAESWAWVNQGGATATFVNKRLKLASPSSATANKRIIKQTLPSGNWVYRATVAREGVTGTNVEVGMCLRENATGKLLTFNLGESGGEWIWVARWTDATTFSATPSSLVGVNRAINAPWVMEIEYDGTNYYFRYSLNNVQFTQLYSEAQAAFFTTGADEIGLFAYNDCSVATTLHSSEFYRVA